MKLGVVTSLSTVIVLKSEVSDQGETSACLATLVKLASTSSRTRATLPVGEGLGK